MSKDLPEGLAFKEDLNLYRYCNGNLNFSTVSHDDEDYVYQKKKIMRDPMSHRIIEKRRRDRMNNCLADLSRLIPPGYLKKGRGRIEKTEIIEMAIKHMRHLQSIISSSRSNEGQCENPAGSSPEGTPNKHLGVSATAPHQPIVMEHYRLGYLECLSEAMHFLVEVQGYFAGDSLCVQMINHLHKHCDKILKSDSLNHPRKHIDTTSSNSSTSPTNGSYGNNSPPLGLSLSNGSNSDDNQVNLSYENVQSPRRYSDFLPLKKNCSYLRYSEPENERVSENPSDSDAEQGYSSNGRNRETREYLNGYHSSPKCRECIPKDCSSSSGIGSNPAPYDDILVKEENCSSQLRDMLTSPRPIHPLRESEIKRSTSPPVFGCDTNRQRSQGAFQATNRSNYQTEIFKYKIAETEEEGAQEVHQESAPGNMYKFKNNIKQRFSKEKRNHESEEDHAGKKIKLTEAHAKEVSAEEEYKRKRSFSETETHPESDRISNRLSFGHKMGNRSKEGIKYPKLPSPCPNPEMPIYYKPSETGRKPIGLLAITEYLSSEQGLLRKYPAPESVGIPIFALHSKGSFYIPLTLDQSILSPFLSLLGLTKTEEIEDKPVLHPVTISVNFQTSYLSKNSKHIAIPWK